MDELDKAVEVLCRNLFWVKNVRSAIAKIDEQFDGLTASFS